MFRLVYKTQPYISLSARVQRAGSLLVTNQFPICNYALPEREELCLRIYIYDLSYHTSFVIELSMIFVQLL